MALEAGLPAGRRRSPASLSVAPRLAREHRPLAGRDPQPAQHGRGVPGAREHRRRYRANGVSSTHHVAVLTDMTAIRRAEKELQHLAHHDPVTELPNRLLAADRLQQALDHAVRRQGQVGVMFVDLDRFKLINDTFGHGVGDKLLRVVAQRMRTRLRAQDTVARLGGDEFLVVLDEARSSESVASVADSLLTTIAQPVDLEEGQLIVSGSIGIEHLSRGRCERRRSLAGCRRCIVRGEGGGPGRLRLPHARDDGCGPALSRAGAGSSRRPRERRAAASLPTTGRDADRDDHRPRGPDSTAAAPNVA